MVVSVRWFTHFNRQMVIGETRVPTQIEMEEEAAAEEAEQKKKQLDKDSAQMQEEELFYRRAAAKAVNKKYAGLKRQMKVDAVAAEQKRRRVGEHEWGEYPLETRLNVDQVPFCLDQSKGKGYFPVDDKACAIPGQTGADKRFGTIQLCLHGGAQEKAQPKLAMIWFGKGTTFIPAEEDAYHPDVHCYGQKCATADENFNNAFRV